MNTTTPTTRRFRRTLLTAVPVALATGALLAGCSTASTGGDAGSSGNGTTSGTATAGRYDEIGDAAQKAAGSGTIISLERESSGTWEVLLSGDDGTETEVNLADDGSTTAEPSTKPGDAEDQAENTRFVDAATLSWREAGSRMLDTQKGDLRELNLDDYNGSIVWEGDVVDSANTTHSIKIDAGSGDVVANATDAPDGDD